MIRIRARLFDMTPAPIYQGYRWVIERPRHIKWWFQRANGKLPYCDLYDYKHTLASSIKQGLEYLLREDGFINFKTDSEHRKMKKELERALDWFRHYKAYEVDRTLIVLPEGYEKRTDGSDAICYMTKTAFKEYEKQRKEAFKILGKYFNGLWD